MNTDLTNLKNLSDIDLKQKQEELFKKIGSARKRYDWNAYQKYFRLYILAKVAKYYK